MVKSIQISDENWKRLYLLKIELGKKSFNEVISVLLSSYKSIDLQSYRSIESQNYKPIKLQNYKSIESQKTEEEEEIVSGITKREVEKSHESIEDIEEEEISLSDVISEVEEEEKEEKEERPATIGDAIVRILSERAREPKELLKMLIDMGFPAKESEKTIEELIKKDVIEVCEVQLGRWGKQSFLRLKPQSE